MPKWPMRRSKGAAGTADEGDADARGGGDGSRAQGGAWMVKLAVAVIVVVVGVMVFRPGREGAPAAEAGSEGGSGGGGAARGAGTGAGTRAAKRPIDDGKPPLRTTRGEVQAAANEGAPGEAGGAAASGAGAASAGDGAAGAAPAGAGAAAPGAGGGPEPDASEKPQPARPLPPPPAHAPPELVDLVTKAMLNRDAIAAAADGGKPADPAAAAEAKRLAGEINEWIAREADNDRRVALIEWVAQAMDPAREPPAPAPGNAP